MQMGWIPEHSAFSIRNPKKININFASADHMFRIVDTWHLPTIRNLYVSPP